MLLGVALIWGASFLLIKFAIEDASPVQVVTLRAIGGAFVLLAVLRVQGQRIYATPQFLAGIVVLGLVSTVMPFLLITWAETRIDSGPTALLNATTPLFTMAFAAGFLGDERIGSRGVLGVLLGIVGVAVLLSDDLGSFDSSSFVAEMAVILASAGYGVGAVMVRIMVRVRSAIVLSALQISVSAAFLSAMMAGTGDLDFDFSTKVWLSIGTMAFVSTGVAYIGYYWLIENVGSVRASLVTYVIPIVAVALGAVFLSEPLSWNTFAGGGLIVLAVFFASRGTTAIARPPQRVAAALDHEQTAD